MRKDYGRDEWTVIDQLRVRYRIAEQSDGDSVAETHPPLLFLHGLGCSAEAWSPSFQCLMRACASQFSVLIAPDFPGYGCSEKPQKTLSIPELADWTVRFLDQLGVPRAHLVGNSMGCQAALSLALRYPDRVGSLVLVGPTVGDHRVPFLRYLIGLMLDGFCEPLGYNLVLLKMYAQMGLRRYLATVKKMMEEDSLGYAGEIDAPCLVLRGQRDKVIPLRAAQTLAGTMPNGQFALVPHAAHALQFSNPEQFSEQLAAFIAGRSKEAAAAL